MTDTERFLFYFLRMGLYGDTPWPALAPVPDDWKGLFDLSCQQAVLGIVADGVAQTAMRPPLSLWHRWVALLVRTEMMNEEMAFRADGLIDMLAVEGIQALVFKGTSVARWYPKPKYRSCGDIDLVVYEGWERLAPSLRQKGIPYYIEDKAVVVERLSKIAPGGHRMDFRDGLYRVEFHPTYEFIYNPLMNARLRRIAAGTSPWWNTRYPQGGRPHEVPEFYLACVILHLRRHVLSYGTGLKQVCDVAVMMKYADVNPDRLQALLQHLGAWRFGKALLGFIDTYLHDATASRRPRGVSGTTRLLYAIFMGDGYTLKARREVIAQAAGLSAWRVVMNAWFWVKRSARLFRLMPGEAFSFMAYKFAQRVWKLCRLGGRP